MPVTRILHRAGDHTELHRLAGHPAVDAIALDAWVRGRHVTVQPGRRPGPGGLLAGIPRLGSRRAHAGADLEPVLAAIEGRAGVLLHVHGHSGDPAAEVARELVPWTERLSVRVTSDAWEVADRLREWLPTVEVAYAIDSESRLLWYLDARDRGLLRETPLTVQHTLIHTPDEVEVLRRRAGRVSVGIVDDIDRAIELAEWGVDEVESSHVVVLNSL